MQSLFRLLDRPLYSYFIKTSYKVVVHVTVIYGAASGWDTGSPICSSVIQEIIGFGQFRPMARVQGFLASKPRF